MLVEDNPLGRCLGTRADKKKLESANDPITTLNRLAWWREVVSFPAIAEDDTMAAPSLVPRQWMPSVIARPGARCYRENKRETMVGFCCVT